MILPMLALHWAADRKRVVSMQGGDGRWNGWGFCRLVYHRPTTLTQLCGSLCYAYIGQTTFVLHNGL